jgi:2'-5' RNA ligase
MQGIVSTLDNAHNLKIEALWSELEHTFGLKYACVAYPHFSYQVAEAYDITDTLAALQALARETPPFTIRTTGLGIFTGEKPVLYVDVVRDARLSSFHQRVLATVAPFAHSPHDHHFGPDYWTPHVTLAMGDLTSDMLPDVVDLLGRRSFAWEININDIALVVNAAGTREDWICMKLGETAAQV